MYSFIIITLIEWKQILYTNALRTLPIYAYDVDNELHNFEFKRHKV